MLHRTLATLLLLSTTAFLNAELPPGSYDKLRAEADDAVTIQVTSVKVEAGTANKDVTVTARILGVERSKSGLKKGDTITFDYRVPTTSFPGPRPIPILVKDDVYPAFCKMRDKKLEPAAYGESFKMTPEAVSRR